MSCKCTNKFAIEQIYTWVVSHVNKNGGTGNCTVFLCWRGRQGCNNSSTIPVKSPILKQCTIKTKNK